MRSEARAIGFAVLLAGLSLVALLPADRVAGQPSPQSVTTDTPEYCLHLRDLIGRMTPVTPAGAPSEVANLSSEGERMCDEGQVRGGILRLRRALIILRDTSPKP